MTSALKIDTVHFTPVKPTDTKAAPVNKKKELALASGQEKLEITDKVQVKRTVVYPNAKGKLISETRDNSGVIARFPEKDPKVGIVVARFTEDVNTAKTYTKNAQIVGTTETPLGKDPTSED